MQSAALPITFSHPRALHTFRRATDSVRSLQRCGMRYDSMDQCTRHSAPATAH